MFLGQTTFPLDDVGLSSAIDRTASDYTDAGEKVKKIRELIRTQNYDADIARYIPVSRNGYFRVCLKILILRKKLLVPPT